MSIKWTIINLQYLLLDVFLHKYYEHLGAPPNRYLVKINALSTFCDLWELFDAIARQFFSFFFSQCYAVSNHRCFSKEDKVIQLNTYDVTLGECFKKCVSKVVVN